MSNPVLVATAAHARAVHKGDPERIALTRSAVFEAKIAQAIENAIAAAPPITADARDRLASLLLGGGK